MKEMQFQIEINATKEKVWNTLWEDNTFRQWADFIDPGTYMIGDLKEGNEVQFISASGYGVTSLAEKLVPGEFLQLKHQVDTQDSGEREREEQWTGGEESYSLIEKGEDLTVLTITLDVPLELLEEFKVSYPKALEEIKLLAERER